MVFVYCGNSVSKRFLLELITVKDACFVDRRGIERSFPHRENTIHVSLVLIDFVYAYCHMESNTID